VIPALVSESRAYFYFVRHGETDWNAERRLQGQRDIPLNALGRRQSARCGGILRDLLARGGRTPAAFTYVASPLSRARETMEILRGSLGLPPEGYATDHRLAELSFGHWEGLTYREVRDRDRSVLAARERDKWNFAPPDGESYADLLVRVRDWYSNLAGDVVVASHGGVARVFAVLFGVRSPADATHGDVVQGAVYGFTQGAMTRHD
jgi:broad specificity phosphatase PhoE